MKSKASIISASKKTPKRLSHEIRQSLNEYGATIVSYTINLQDTEHQISRTNRFLRKDRGLEQFCIVYVRPDLRCLLGQAFEYIAEETRTTDFTYNDEAAYKFTVNRYLCAQMIQEVIKMAITGNNCGLAKISSAA